MPKSRGSGSIASAGNSSNNRGSENTNGGSIISSGSRSVGELANRLLDRLSQVGPVNVEMESTTRGGIENVQVSFDPNSPGQANVHSASGNTYLVNYNDDTCTCPNHRYRDTTCRHIVATHRALGQIAAAPPQPEVHNGDSINPENVVHVIESQAQVDQIDEEQRRNLQPIDEDDDFFYTDNEEAFQEALDIGHTAQLDYDYENALNGSQITFGLEVEFVGGDADAIARELYTLGICGYDRRVGYHHQSVPGKWKLERDGSVSSGSSGGELVSPVLKDTPETWRTLEKICDVAKRHGARIDSRCGGHVHIGMDPLDTARQRWRRFFRTIGSYEDVLYRLAGGTEGRVRSGYTGYAVPFQNRARDNASARFELNSEADVNTLARNASGYSRYYGINLTNIYESNKPDTVEFRYFNSSLDPRQLQANVKIANGIMMASEKARTQDDPGSNIFPSDAMKRRGMMLKEHSIGSDVRTDNIGIKNLIDIIFTRKKDKDNMLKVYARNQWA